MPAVQPQPPLPPEPAAPGPAFPGVPVSGLVPPLGPPVQVPRGVHALAVTAGMAVVAALSVWCGREMASRDLDKLHALPYVVPLGAVFAVVLLAWLGTVWKVRTDGRVLEGTGVLGRQGIDLAELTGVAATANRGRVSLTLRTPAGGLTVDTGTLQKAGPQVLDVLGRAVWAGQEQGRYVVPVAAAAVWGMPVQPGAPKNGRTGATGPALISIAVLVVALVVGVVLGLD